MANLISIGLEKFILTMRIITVECTAHITTIILMAVIWIWESLPCNDARPGIVNIDIAGIVEHVSGESARRAHIHFEREQTACGILTEEFKVEEALTDVERFQHTAPK